MDWSQQKPRPTGGKNENGSRKRKVAPSSLDTAANQLPTTIVVRPLRATHGSAVVDLLSAGMAAPSTTSPSTASRDASKDCPPAVAPPAATTRTMKAATRRR